MTKFIEDGFPFAELSRIAKQESWRKEIYRPVYYIHKWWARRLGSVFRGIILGTQLDDAEDFWNHFYGKNNFSEIVLFDPFMGSGVTVGEGIKLGCRVIGRDINPVAVAISRAAFNTYDRSAIRKTFSNLENDIAPKLLQYFHTLTSNGDHATVLYNFLVKIVDCPFCLNSIDLFKSRIFSKNAVPKKDPSARSICPKCERIVHTQYNSTKTQCTHCNHIYNPQHGNISGSIVSCPHCNNEFKLVERLKSIEGPLKFRRYAKLILTQTGEKVYEEINNFDLENEKLLAQEYNVLLENVPKVPIQPGHNTNQILKHNYKYWHELFSDRQLVCASLLKNSIQEIDNEDNRMLFASLFSGTLEFNNLFTSFKGEGTGAVRHMFSNHVLKPEMMPLEANLWGTLKSSGSFSGLYKTRVERALNYKEDPTEVMIPLYSKLRNRGINHPLSTPLVVNFKGFSVDPTSTYISQGDSSSTDIPSSSVDLVVTDPPFFDNVHYSELADFFYYWLNQVVDLGHEETTRSVLEVQDVNAEDFTRKLTSVFLECNRVLKDDGLFVFTYHHARHEGWLAVHRAIRDAGFACVRAYPIKAEMSVSIPLQQTKSPINLDLILFCRKDLKKSLYFTDASSSYAIERSKEYVKQLIDVDIPVSLSDAKVILMGQLMCEAHKLKSSKLEEDFLNKANNSIDSCLSQIILTQDIKKYSVNKLEQLRLFERMGDYFLDH